VRFGRDTHAGFSGVCKRKAESSDWVTTESLGNALRTSRFQYGFWAGSEAKTQHDPHNAQPRHTTQNPSPSQTHTFGSRRAVLFRSRGWLGVPVQGSNRETARDFRVDDRRVACRDGFQSLDEQKRLTRTEFLPEPLRRDMV
jgi:hypothetical protein